MPLKSQNKFYGGILGEGAWGRADITKFGESMAVMRNFLPLSHGAAANRPGQEFLAPCYTTVGEVENASFIYNNRDTYTLEVTANRIHILRNGGFVLNPAIAIASIDAGLNEVTTTAPHGLTVGDFVYWVDAASIGHYYWIHTTSTTSKFTLSVIDGVIAVNLSAFTTETIASMVVIATPYAEDKLIELDIAQKADTVTITHHDYHPRELTRTSHTEWTLTEIPLSPVMPKPTGLKATASSVNDAYFYNFNNIIDTKATITDITASSPATIVVDKTKIDGTALGAQAEDNLYEGRIVCISGAVFTGADAADMAAAVNGLNFALKNRVDSGGPPTNTVTFDLYFIGGVALDTSGHTITGMTADTAVFGTERLQYKVTAVSTDGEESFPTAEMDAIASDTLGDDRLVSLGWTGPAGVNTKEYGVYKESNQLYGFIGTALEASFAPYFNDRNIAPELGDNPPEEPIRNPFQTDIESGGISNTNPVSINAIDHKLVAGHRAIITGGDHAEFVDGKYFVRSVTDEDNFTINDENGDAVDGSGWAGAYTAGGTVSDYPRTVAYYKQRRIFASRYNARQTVDASATSQHSTFSSASDAFSFPIEETDANDIFGMLSGSDLLLFTSGSVVLSSGDGGSYSLATVNNVEQMAAGIDENVEPLKMRNSIIYVQDKHSKVFDLAYTFEQNKYLGNDLTLLVPQLIESARIVSWAYQRVPEPMVYSILDTGLMIAMLYERDNSIFGWCEYETLGQYKSVTVTPEGSDDSPHFVMERELNNSVTKKFHERAWNRKFVDVEDCRFLDAYTVYEDYIECDSIKTGLSASVYPASGSVPYSNNDIVLLDGFIEDVPYSTVENPVNGLRYEVMDIRAAFFHVVYYETITSSADLTSITLDGTDIIVTHDGTLTIPDYPAVKFSGTGILDGGVSIDDEWFGAEELSPTTLKLKNLQNGADLSGAAYAPTSSTSGTFKVSAYPSVAAGEVVGSSQGNIGSKAYARSYLCKAVISGLEHLEGADTVSALADGNHVSGLDVVNGQVTLPSPTARACIGLPYEARMDSLPINTPDGKSIEIMRSVSDARFNLYKTRGLQAGASYDTLHEMPERTTEGYNETTRLHNGEVTIEFEPDVENKGSVVIVNPYPLPSTIQAMGIQFSAGSDE